MRASTKRILSIFLSGFFLMGLVVVVSAIIRPELDKAVEKRATLFSKKNLFENQREVVGQVQQLNQEFQEFARLQETVSLAMPVSENTTQILSQFDAIARTSGAKITSFNINPQPFRASKQPLTRRLGVLEVRVTAEGNYDSVKNFIRFLETNVRVFSVERLIMASVLSGEKGRTFQIDLTGEAYFQE